MDTQIQSVQEVRNISVGRKYLVQFEQSAVKGQLGYKIEAYDDDPAIAMELAKALLKEAQKVAPALEVSK